jgi:hypothetical protein
VLRLPPGLAASAESDGKALEVAPSGDCFLVYPGPRSSIRFERLREGIADYEKIRVLRGMLGRRKDAKATAALARLDSVLKRFTFEESQKNPAADALNAAQKVVEVRLRTPFAGQQQHILETHRLQRRQFAVQFFA